MALGEDTKKLLALKLPYSHHLIEDLEHECETIATRYEGFGRIGIIAQGLRCGRLLVKCFEMAFTRRIDDEEQRQQKIK